MRNKHRFTPIERFVIFTVHGEKCYLCTAPLNLNEMTVDHILPESLIHRPDRLSVVLSAFGLPTDFNLNGFENWLPACVACNSRKHSTVFVPTPIVQLYLQAARGKVDIAAKMMGAVVRRAEVARALNTIARAVSEDGLPDTSRAEALRLLMAAEPYRSQGRTGLPMRFTKTASASHRIAHVEEDQKHAICLDERGLPYRIRLDGAIPDVGDRGTQEGILRLIEENLDVDSVWDHWDGACWVVSARRRCDGSVVRLAAESDRARAVVISFVRLPINLPGPGLMSRTAESPLGTVFELADEDRPEDTYCFLLSTVRDRHVPLGPARLEAALFALGRTPESG